MVYNSAEEHRFSEHTGIDAIPDPANRPPRFWIIALTGLIVVASLLTVSFWIVGRMVEERRQIAVERLQERLEVETQGKLETLSTWIDGLAARGNRVIRSELVALFAAESQLIGTDPELARALDEQRPYMRQVLDGLAEAHELRGVYLLQRDGKLLLQDRDAPTLRHETQSAIQQAFDAGNRRAINVRLEQGTWLIDIYQPLQANMGTSLTEDIKPAVLMLTTELEPFLINWLTLKGNWRSAENLSLQVTLDDQFQRLAVQDSRIVGTITAAMPPAGFMQTPDLDFRQVALHQETGWQVLQQVHGGPVFAGIDEFAKAAHTLAVALAFALTSALVALFWRQTASHHRHVADQYRSFATRIREQAAILDAVMTATADLVLLRGPKGELLFGNRAFEDKFVRAAGSNSAAGNPTDEFFHAVEQANRDSIVEIEIFNERCAYHIERQDIYSDTSGTTQLIVARNVTQMLDRQRGREELLEQIIEALARATELVDPYLEGHASRVGSLCARLADSLGLDLDERKTLQRAATLSQFGKIFIPTSILTKRGRHSLAEEEIMRTHIDHAMTVLNPIDFDQPIVETLAQMHERMDGSGYPRGETAANINMTARILGICDVFCARTWPRSYRSAKSQSAICDILEEQNRRYDPFIVQHLRRLIDTQEIDDLKPTVVNRSLSEQNSRPELID